MIYLDSAATSLLKPHSVYNAMRNAMNTMASPGRGTYESARNAADKVYECRELVCKLFNAPAPENIVFTMNATHGLNIAIRSIVSPGDRVVISGFEHNSVTRALKAAGADIIVAKSDLFDTAGTVEAFMRAIPGAKAVVCNHVSNVFGFILPVSEIAEICRRYSVPLIIDASQSAGVLPIDLAQLKPAFAAMPGHKGLLGPQGTGVLICGGDAKPLIYGGTGSDSIQQDMPDYLPDMLEAGTHNVVGIAGLCEGLKYVLNKTPEVIGRYESELCRMMADELKGVSGLEVFAGENGSQSGVLSVRHGSVDSETLCQRLGNAGIAARCGLHCAPLAHRTAGTIDGGTLRLSFSPFLRQCQVSTAARTVKRIIEQEN